MTDGAKRIDLKTKEVGPFNHNDYCYERGESILYKADNSVLDKGKYVRLPNYKLIL